jgi:ferric-dicitrate binding protein FerR (iron transport regulator)
MNQFESPTEVEELSELSWKRIEQRVFQGIDQGLADPQPVQNSSRAERRPRAVLWLASAGAIAAAAALFVVTRPAPSQTAGEAQAVAQRSRVVTQSTSSEILVGDAEIELAPESVIWIDRAGEELALTLDDGGVRLKVAPRQGRAPVSVHAGKVRIEVIGTEFGVYRSADRTDVEVFEGIVSVVADGKRTRVSAGESWSSADGAEATPKKRKKRRRAKKDKPSLVDDKPAPTARELFEQAAALESSAPEAAVALYKQVAGGQGAWAANALYAQGRLEHARGKTAAASAILRRYLNRYPQGANAQDAQELLESAP